MKLKELLEKLGNFLENEEVMVCADGSSEVHEIEFTSIEHVEDNAGGEGGSVILWVSSDPEAKIYEE